MGGSVVITQTNDIEEWMEKYLDKWSTGMKGLTGYGRVNVLIDLIIVHKLIVK